MPRHYVQSTRKIRSFLEKIKTERRPDHASIKWLNNFGFTSSTDEQFLSILETIGFVDSGRIPTDRWKNFQDKNKSGRVMAEALKDGYSILYKTYKEAHKKAPDDLIQVFKVELQLGEETAKKAYRTFSTLADFADFTLEKSLPEPEKPTEVVKMAPQVTLDEIQRALLSVKEKRELAVNINIQITLPEKGEPEDYDKIFAALKKHFFSE